MYKYLQSIFVKQDANCSVRWPKKKFEPRPQFCAFSVIPLFHTPILIQSHSKFAHTLLFSSAYTTVKRGRPRTSLQKVIRKLHFLQNRFMKKKRKNRRMNQAVTWPPEKRPAADFIFFLLLIFYIITRLSIFSRVSILFFFSFFFLFSI